MECIGLHLRVSKDGRKFFPHWYRHLSRKKCLTLGEFPHLSVAEARRKVGEHKALLASLRWYQSATHSRANRSRDNVRYNDYDEFDFSKWGDSGF